MSTRSTSKTLKAGLIIAIVVLACWEVLSRKDGGFRTTLRQIGSIVTRESHDGHPGTGKLLATLGTFILVTVPFVFFVVILLYTETGRELEQRSPFLGGLSHLLSKKFTSIW